MIRSFIAAIALLIVTGSTRAADVYALLICDTDAQGGISESVKTDQKNISDYLHAAFDDDDDISLHLTVLTGEDVTYKNVYKEIRNLKGKVKKKDTVFVYYSGHGGISSHG